MTIVFDTETIRIITLFENITNANVKDCIIRDDVVYVLVDEGDLKKVLGQRGMLIKMIERILGKRVKVFEYSRDVVEFIEKAIPRVISLKVRNENGKKTIEIRVDRSVRGLVIGRNRRNLKIYKELLERHYGVDELKVV